MRNLPGCWTTVSVAHECEVEGCTAPAHNRLQGETDSFGAECMYYCAEHKVAEEATLAQAAEVSRHCDCCDKLAKLYPTRDWEEGIGGQVYDVCAECRPNYLGHSEDDEGSRIGAMSFCEPRS